MRMNVIIYDVSFTTSSTRNYTMQLVSNQVKGSLLSLTGATPGTMLKESQNSWKFFCSGRRFCSGVLVSLEVSTNDRKTSMNDNDNENENDNDNENDNNNDNENENEIMK